MKKFNIVFSLLLSILIYSEAYSSEVTTNIKYEANNDLLVNWSQELQLKEKFETPYVGIFKDQRRVLRFIAVDHTRNPESETFKLIQNQIQEFDPQIVIIEGRETVEGINPKSLLSFIQYAKSNPNVSYVEGAYTAILSLEKGIPFVGGEPSGQQIRKSIENQSYFQIKDLIAFSLLQEFPKDNSLEGHFNLTAEMNKAYAYIAERYQLKTNEILNEKDFLSWYQEKLGKDFKPELLSSMDLAPICTGDALFTQKLNCKLNRIRNVNTTNLIAELINKYDRVFIVSGAGHLVEQKNVLINMLGLETYFKL